MASNEILKKGGALLIGSIIAFGVLGACGLTSLRMGGINYAKKREAERKGEAYYFDSLGKTRSVETDEVCTINICDVRHSGHNTITGVETGKVYVDFTKETIDKVNKILHDSGARYEWREYTSSYTKIRSRTPWQKCLIAYDLVKQMPYQIMFIDPACKKPGINHEAIWYCNPSECGFMHTKERKYITDEEYAELNYGTLPFPTWQTLPDTVRGK